MITVTRIGPPPKGYANWTLRLGWHRKAGVEDQDSAEPTKRSDELCAKTRLANLTQANVAPNSVRVVSESRSKAALFACAAPAPRFQIGTQSLPVRHVARRQYQAFPAGSQPCRQTRNQLARRAPSPLNLMMPRRRPPAAAFVVAMAAEGVLQIVIRPRQVREIVTPKQAALSSLLLTFSEVASIRRDLRNARSAVVA